MLTLNVAIFHSFASLMSVESQCAFIAHPRRLLEWKPGDLYSLQYALDVGCGRYSSPTSLPYAARALPHFGWVAVHGRQSAQSNHHRS